MYLMHKEVLVWDGEKFYLILSLFEKIINRLERDGK